MNPDRMYIDDFLWITRAHANQANRNTNHPAPNAAATWQEIADALNEAADKIHDAIQKTRRTAA